MPQPQDPRRSRVPVLDTLGKLCTEGKQTAEYLWQVPKDETARTRIAEILQLVAAEAAKQGRKEMGRIVQELLPAARASASPQQVELLVDGFDRLTRLWEAAKSGLL